MTPVFTVITRVNPEADEKAVARDEQDMIESTGGQPRDKGKPLLTPSEVTMYSVIGFGWLLLALVIVALWLRAKTRGTEIYLRDQERNFERDMLGEFGPAAGKGDGGAIDGTAKAANRESGVPKHTQSNINGDDQLIGPGAMSANREAGGAQPLIMGAGKGAGQSAGSAADAEAALNASAARSAFDTLAEDVCRRLETAGLLQSREGPLLLSDSDSRGLMVRLRGDKLALILGDWESEKFYLRQFKRFEVIFIARGDGEVTVLQPMGRFMGDRVSL